MSTSTQDISPYNYASAMKLLEVRNPFNHSLVAYSCLAHDGFSITRGPCHAYLLYNRHVFLSRKDKPWEFISFNRYIEGSLPFYEWMFSKESPWRDILQFIDSRSTAAIAAGEKGYILFKDVRNANANLLYNFCIASRIPWEHPLVLSMFNFFVKKGIHPTIASVMALWFLPADREKYVARFNGTFHTWLCGSADSSKRDGPFGYMSRTFFGKPKMRKECGTYGEVGITLPAQNMFVTKPKNKEWYKDPPCGTAEEIAKELEEYAHAEKSRLEKEGQW